MRILRPFLDAAPAGVARGSSHTLSETTPPLLAPLDVDRDRLVRAATTAGLVAVAERLKACGRGPVAWDRRPGWHAPLVDAHGNLVRCVASCRHRLCSRCARKRAKAGGTRLRKLIDTWFQGPAIFLTLTRAAPAGEPLCGSADAVQEAFTRFRSYKRWKTNVLGGFYVVQFADANLRHVHIHAIIDAKYGAQAEWAKQWNRCLRGSRKRGPAAVGGVDISRARDTSGCIAYMLRPPSVGSVELPSVSRAGAEADGADTDADLAAVSTISDGDLASMIRWMHGRRLVQTFGSLHGVPVQEPQAVSARRPEPGRIPGRKRRVFNSATGEEVLEIDVAWQFSDHAQAIAAGQLQGERPRLSARMPDGEADHGA